MRPHRNVYAVFHTDITFFDQKTNKFKLVQPEEIDQLLTSLLKQFPGVLAVMPVLPFLIIECNPLPDPTKHVNRPALNLKDKKTRS